MIKKLKSLFKRKPEESFVDSVAGPMYRTVEGEADVSFFETTDDVINFIKNAPNLNIKISSASITPEGKMGVIWRPLHRVEI